MAISSTTRTAGPFTGTGSVSDFAFAFKVFATSDVRVRRTVASTGVTSTLVENADYTVDLNPNQEVSPGGTVTLTGGALAVNDTLLLSSAVSSTQPVDITNQSGFYPSVVNDALDRATILVQQAEQGSVRVPADEFGINMQLPAATSRANQYLAFDSNGAVNIGGAIPAQVYYGAFAADPTTRNDGTAMQAGDLYYSTATSEIKVFTGSLWSSLTAAIVNGNVANNLTVGGTATVAGSTTLAAVTASGAATFTGGMTSLPNAVAPTSNIAIGPSAGSALQSAAANNTLIGLRAGDAIATSGNNVAIGTDALGSAVANQTSVAIGAQALRVSNTTSSNTAVGFNAGGATTTGANNAFFGQQAGGSGNQNQTTSLGHGASATWGPSFSQLTSVTNGVYIGWNTNPSAATESNAICIGHRVLSNGSNTTTINNAGATATYISGTATSVLALSGNTLRIVNSRTPASATATGTAGDICWDSGFMYVCVATDSWKRVAIAAW